MSKTNDIDSTELAETLVKDSGKVQVVDVCLTPMFRRTRLLYDDYAPYAAERIISYPPSVTDQTHALSISEQVKVGQAQVRQDDIASDYDFKPGEEDDGRSVIGVYDYSEPAERFEAERQNALAIENELKTQVAKRRSDDLARQRQIEARGATQNEKTGKDTSEPLDASNTPSRSSAGK